MRIRTTPLHAGMTLCGSNEKVSSPLNRFLNILESKYSLQLDRLEKR
jgi:hypothetical protein